ncbi:hypothetical protein Golob_014092 [Gossypium lobatum]|uniref:Uncharacterized protein n=1 Tax=Gossypium lobatum TaxID=34289 RepID=A0A7J8LRG0_9ROSI|nr:hypothetical protein [Gossypium lobatum]
MSKCLQIIWRKTYLARCELRGDFLGFRYVLCYFRECLDYM